MVSALVIAGAAVAGVLLIAVIYFVFVARELRATANKSMTQRAQNSHGAPRRTLAEEDASLEAGERAHKEKLESEDLAWGNHHSEIPVDLVDIVAKGGAVPMQAEPGTRVLAVDNEPRQVFTNPLFNEPAALENKQILATPQTPRRGRGSSNHSLSSRTRTPLLSRRRKKDSKANPYPGSSVLPSSGHGTSWTDPCDGYKPVPYTAPGVASFPVWADPGIITVLRGSLNFNALDTSFKPPVDRRSHLGLYQIVEGLPRNPVERTGIAGRGLLGRWGPNHAGDPIVTRWAFDPQGEPVYRAGKRVLEVVTISRADNGLKALPGGFCDPGEPVTETVKREFGEEALAKLKATPTEQLEIQERLDRVFKAGHEMFKGYVKDPRNTDNAWVETVAINYHDEAGNALAHFPLSGGDDATAACWSMVSKDMVLYADHLSYLEQVAKRLDAYWADGMFAATVQLPMKEKTMQVDNLMYDAPPVGAAAAGGVFASGRPAPDMEEEPVVTPPTPTSITGGVLPVRTSAVYADSAEIRRNKSLHKSLHDKAKPELPPRSRETSAHASETSGAKEPTPAAVSEAMGERKSSKAAHEFQVEGAKRPSQAKASAAPAAPAEPAKSEGHVGTYQAKYLGGITTTNPGGNDVVQACVKAAKMQKHKEQPVVDLTVAAEGIKAIRQTGQKPKAADTVINIPIRQVSFTGSDTSNKKIFAFIANDPKTLIMVCHVFECKCKGRLVSDAVKKAFALAQQLRTDPFAIRRDGRPTPEALSNFEQRFLMDRTTLKAKMVIGHGQYGKVFLSTSTETPDHKKVAVKLMRPDVNNADAEEFLTEAKMMAELQHPHLLQFLGICLEKKPWLLVVEFMQYKDLGIVLRQCKKHEVLIRMHEMLYFADQVVSAMLYLGQMRFVHRDIAARNVLLHHNNQVKLGDFGLTRKLPDGQDYWRLDKAGRLPVKYMSVETLTIKRFSSASDVWAFGVLWWEILSYAATPFQKEKIPNTEIRNELIKGTRLGKPDFVAADDFTHDEESESHARTTWDRTFQELSWNTWHKEMADRPTFKQLQGTVKKFLQEENERNPPPRDIGLLCFQALETNRSMKRKIGERGGSIIRAGGLRDRDSGGSKRLSRSQRRSKRESKRQAAQNASVKKKLSRSTSFRGAASNINAPSLAMAEEDE
eukprot:m.144800 g.144800  ORF g.144800 m.144800 type:complete len:1163 (-) comp17205_c1_seq1:107-3595(-)